MWLLARTRRYLAGLLVDPRRSAKVASSQNTARTNAAEASATLLERRRNRDDVEAYLRAWRLRQPAPPPTTGSSGSGSTHGV